MCVLTCLASGALEHKQELWTAFRSQDRGNKLLQVCSCQLKENSVTAYQLFILLFLYKQTLRLIFVKAVVEDTVACGDEGQTLLPNDLCHSFNTVNWTSLTLARTVQLSLFVSECWRGLSGVPGLAEVLRRVDPGVAGLALSLF